MSGYTVIDLETTGLSPEKTDRVVEVGVVYVSESGAIQDHWSTLINPERDVGPTRIHGISPTDLSDAPRFAEVAPYLLRAVAGRTIVAHNATFDLRFLAREFLRSGISLERLPLDGLCTMQWSSTYLTAPSRRLIDCCRACGISLENAHSAHADAYATAQLLAHYIGRSGGQLPWRETLDRSSAYTWPGYVGEYPQMKMVRREQVRAVRQDTWLDEVVSRMPRAANPQVDAYLAVLEMALIDGFLAEHEKAALVSVARESGLTRGQVLDLHADYLRAMAEVALEDRVVTAQERADLESVAGMLGLRSTDVEAAVSEAQSRMASGMAATDAVASAAIDLLPGDRVVFTGDMLEDRSIWEERARAIGLEPGGISKKTKIVVAADPNSFSGKAAKARSYGIPIVTEAAFGRLLSAAVS